MCKHVQNKKGREHITIYDDEEIVKVNEFVYLGSQITNKYDDTKKMVMHCWKDNGCTY